METVKFIDICKIAYTRIPKCLFRSIKDEICNQLESKIIVEKIANDVMNGYLTSTQKELPLNFADIEKFVLDLIAEHEKKFVYFEESINGKIECKNKPPKLKCENIWFVTQKPGGYFPLHYHSGIYSFVIWINIPYLFSTDSTPESAEQIRDGMFEFLYSNHFGKIENYLLPIDKTWEGTIAVFPSEMWHQVYPFYSSNPNDLRISVAGDVFISQGNFLI